MGVSQGDKLPEAKLLKLGPDGPAAVGTADLAHGRVALFAVPGAFTGTCTNAHMPSFVRVADALRDKGIDRIICVTVNDPFVAGAWARETGADKAGIEVWADADGSFTKAMGMEFDAPPAGLFGRSKRYALLARDGAIETLQLEESPGQCSISSGEELLKSA